MNAAKLDSLGGRPGGQRVPREGCQNGPLSYNSGMAGLIATKFGVWLEPMYRCISHRSWVLCICTCARAHVQMFPSVSFLGMARQIALKFGVWLEIN